MSHIHDLHLAVTADTRVENKLVVDKNVYGGLPNSTSTKVKGQFAPNEKGQMVSNWTIKANRPEYPRNGGRHDKA